MKRLGIAVAGCLIAGLASVGAPAVAGDDDVIRRGSCSGASSWKLKLSPENAGIEVEYEVDQNKNDQRWRVRLFHNGVRFFKGTRTTQPPSGSFEVRRVVDDEAGTDRIRARARNLQTDEICRGRASI